MDTIFMNSENNKTPKLHVLILKLTDKLGIRIGKKLIALSNHSIYYTWENIKANTIIINLKYQHLRDEFELPNDEFELPNGSYSVSDIEDNFGYILKKHGEDIDKSSVQIYVNEIENAVTCGIRNGYSLELLRPETMKLLGRIKNKITKDKKNLISKLQRYF